MGVGCLRACACPCTCTCTCKPLRAAPAQGSEEEAERWLCNARKVCLFVGVRTYNMRVRILQCVCSISAVILQDNGIPSRPTNLASVVSARARPHRAWERPRARSCPYPLSRSVHEGMRACVPGGKGWSEKQKEIYSCTHIHVHTHTHLILELAHGLGGTLLGAVLSCL